MLSTDRFVPRNAPGGDIEIGADVRGSLSGLVPGTRMRLRLQGGDRIGVRKRNDAPAVAELQSATICLWPAGYSRGRTRPARPAIPSARLPSIQSAIRRIFPANARVQRDFHRGTVGGTNRLEGISI